MKGRRAGAEDAEHRSGHGAEGGLGVPLHALMVKPPGDLWSSSANTYYVANVYLTRGKEQDGLGKMK